MRVLRVFAIEVLVSCLASLNAQTQDAGFVQALQQGTALFDSAYNAWDDSLFLQAERHFIDMAQRYEQSHLPYYWQGVANFYLVSYTLFGLQRDRNTDAAREYIRRGLASLDRALDRKPGDAESLAMWGTLTGMRIYLSPMRAPFLGPSVMQAIQNAMQADSTNPRVHYLVGVSYYFTPAVLGGGVDKGLSYMRRAEELFEREDRAPSDPLEPRWGYSTCLGFIAQAYERKGRVQKARTYYRKALRVNPQDKMARMGLRRLGPANET